MHRLRSFRTILTTGCLLLSSTFLAAANARADIILTEAQSVYVQDFNLLANTGTSTVLPDGWHIAEGGTAGNSTYSAGTGSGTSGDTYSLGAVGSTERALGGLASASVIPQFGVQLKSGGTSPLTELQISYTGEQWRLGAVGRTDLLNFQYSLDATSLTTGSWTDLDQLDFVAPVSSGPTGQLDGNLGANQTFLSGSLTGLSLTAGSSVWLRWLDQNATGSDDALAIDDFRVNAQFAAATPVPEPSSFVVSAALTAALLLTGRACQCHQQRQIRSQAG